MNHPSSSRSETPASASAQPRTVEYARDFAAEAKAREALKPQSLKQVAQNKQAKAAKDS